MENSTESVILTIDEEKKLTLLLVKYIVIDFDETPPRKFITTGQLTFLFDLYLELYGQFSYKKSLSSYCWKIVQKA